MVFISAFSLENQKMPSRISKRPTTRRKGKSAIATPAGSDKANYYGAIIREAKMGPRRELTLRIETWPQGKVTFGSGVVTLRFGAIVNYEEVHRFFKKVRSDGLHFLRDSVKASPHRHVIEMEFDRSEDRIAIIAGRVSRLACE
jgi:hypothetical protein